MTASASPQLGTPPARTGTIIVQGHNGEQHPFQATADSAASRGSYLSGAMDYSSRGNAVIIGPGTYSTKNILKSYSYTISSIARSSNVVTIATSTPHGFIVGDSVRITGAADTTFSGVYPVASVADSTHFTYANNGSNGSTSGGVAQGLCAIHLHHGAHLIQTSGDGGILDDTSNGVNGAVWARITGAGTLTANSANTSIVNSTQSIVNLRQANTRVELAYSSLYSTGDPCIFVSGSATSTELFVSGKTAVCTAGCAVCVNTAMFADISISRITGKASSLLVGTSNINAHIHIDSDLVQSIDALNGSAIAVATTGTAVIEGRIGRMIGNFDYAGGAGNLEFGNIRGLIDVSGDSVAARPMFIKAFVDATAISTSSPAFTPTTGFTLTGLFLDNCRFYCGAAATESISADDALTIYVIGNLGTNKPKNASVTVAKDTYVY